MSEESIAGRETIGEARGPVEGEATADEWERAKKEEAKKRCQKTARQAGTEARRNVSAPEEELIALSRTEGSMPSLRPRTTPSLRAIWLMLSMRLRRTNAWA